MLVSNNYLVDTCLGIGNRLYLVHTYLGIPQLVYSQEKVCAR